MKYLTLLVILLGISQVYTEYSDPVILLTEFTQLHPIVLGQLDVTATVVYDHPDCYKCGQMESTIQEYAEKNIGFTQVYVVDCESMWEDPQGQQSMPMCSPEHTQNLPLISFFEPPQNKPVGGQTQSQQHNFQGSVHQEDLGKFLRKHMPAYRETIKSLEDYEQFLEYPEYENKVILFTNKEKTSPLYKAVASKYRLRILFGEVHENVTEVASQFGIEKFPSIYVLKKKADGTHTPELYLDTLTYENIVDFLEDFALDKKVSGRKPSKKSNNKKQEKQEKKEILPEVKTLKIDLIEKQIYELEKPVLVHIKTPTEQHPTFDEVLKKYKNMFDYFEYIAEDDDQKELAKQHLKAKQFPCIRFYPPGTQKKPYSSFSFGPKEVELKEFHAEFLYQIADHTLPVYDEQTLQQSFQIQLAQQKVVMLYFFEKDVSLSLRVAAMQSEFQQRFAFLSMKNPSKAVQEQFGIQKLPAMIALFRDADLQEKQAGQEEEAPKEGEQVRVAAFSGKFNYKEVSEFLKVWIQAKEGFTSEPKKQVVEITNKDDFKKQCQGQTQCFIAILDGSPELRNDEYSKLGEQIKTLDKLNQRYSKKSVNFVWIDGICHSEILYPLNMSDDQIPNQITFDNSKKSIANMIGRFDYETLSLFTEKTVNNKVSYQALDMERFKIKDYNCIERHEELALKKQEAESQNNEEEDEIMKEILEEERLRKQAMEDEEGKKKRRKKKKGGKSKKSDL